MKAIKTALSSIKGRITDIGLPELPSLGREVIIPVYVIHTKADPEAYFFIFDFEEFVEGSRSGMFVRPKLRLWAGRGDFNRPEFARQFRVSFAQEFEAARIALASQKKGGGWFNWVTGVGNDVVGGPLALFAANVVLLVALSAGRLVLSQILPSALTRAKSDNSKLENSIEDTKQKVDAALRNFDVVLHADLFEHAFGERPPTRYDDMEYDAWPLPEFVTTHLGDKQTTSWW